MAFEKFKRLVNILATKCPVAFPITVRRIAMKDYGNCCLHDNKFTINIKKNLSEEMQMTTLLHEWAHARAWRHCDDKMDDREFLEKCHDAYWGVAYSEVYQAYETYFLIGKNRTVKLK